MENYILFIIIWILLGIHGVYFCIKRATLYQDITTEFSAILCLLLCFLFPIISHFAVAIVYPRKQENHTILFKKVEK